MRMCLSKGQPRRESRACVRLTGYVPVSLGVCATVGLDFGCMSL